MIKIIEDALSEDECSNMFSLINGSKIEHGASSWLGDYIDDLPIYWFDLDTDHPCKDLYIRLLGIASNYFDISAFIGYETWTHVNSRPGGDGVGWHQDKDERLQLLRGITKFPICSLIYYPFVDENMVGGKLEFNDQSILPKTNMLVVFGPGIWHNVEGYTGERCSISIGPWNSKICQIKCYDPNVL